MTMLGLLSGEEMEKANLAPIQLRGSGYRGRHCALARWSTRQIWHAGKCCAVHEAGSLRSDFGCIFKEEALKKITGSEGSEGDGPLKTYVHPQGKLFLAGLL